MAGQIQVIFIVPSGLEPHIRSGKLRALAIASAKRSSALPDVPTSAEAGLPGFETYTWFGLIGPAGLPPAVVARLNADTAKAVASPEVHETLLKQGLEGNATSPEEFTKFVSRETEKWSRIIKAAGIKAEQ
jgi:tripartite-type tricarboxylate transporter receptor subunit TctC